MHLGSKRIKGLRFSTFLCVNFEFLVDFSSRKCTITCLTICMGRNIFFRKILMFFCVKMQCFYEEVENKSLGYNPWSSVTLAPLALPPN